MKFSEHWLREWVNPDISTDDLAVVMTMAGLEVEAIEPVAGDIPFPTSLAAQWSPVLCSAPSSKKSPALASVHSSGVSPVHDSKPPSVIEDVEGVG